MKLWEKKENLEKNSICTIQELNYKKLGKYYQQFKWGYKLTNQVQYIQHMSS